MPAISYRPGPWLGLVRGGTIVLLDGGTREDVAHDLWAVLAGRPTLQSVLGAVVSGYGTDLAALPEFAIISFDGKMHTILRGDVVVNTDGSEGAAELSGQGVTTWTERLLPEQEAFDVVINAGKDGACRWLPLAEGVVQLGGIRVGNDDGGTASSGTSKEDAADLVRAARAEAAAAQEPTAASQPQPHVQDKAPARPANPAASQPQPHVQDQAPAGPANPAASQPQDQVTAGRVLPPAFAPESVVAESCVEGPRVEEPCAEEPDALDAPASDDTLLTPGDAEDLDAEDLDAEDLDAEDSRAAETDAAHIDAAHSDGEGDIEETVVHAKAQRANLPANPPAGDAAYSAPPAQTPPPAVVTRAPAGPPVQALAPAKQTASLIDSVPWLTPSASARARAAESQAAEAAGRIQPSPAQPTPAQPAVPTAPAQPAAPAASRPPLEGDHDGQTLVRSDLKNLPGGSAAPGTPAEPPATTGPMVLARVCPQGHANPPTRSACSRCAAPLASDASEVKRPSLGKMRLSSGEVIELDRPVIVGRQPAASRVQGNVMPQLVQVRSVSGDISRSHLEVRLEGWHVILGDLKATNGTMLIREGQPPRRLGQGESMILFDGDIADLGDGVSLRFEDLL
ncbi:FHA domain-containing protein [Arthrobacter sp. USHLN218]|uniref:FHA domain-containing protein n=1 Tax=Arthrobacter sp. USHLN218 TaxID=3081232 RepID=UPI0030174966